LKNLKEIGGFELRHCDRRLSAEEHKAFVDGCFVFCRHDVNSLTLHMQNGPVKENGVNGCQVDTLLHIAHQIISGLNKKFPHKENAAALAHISEALAALERRKAERTARGVEGLNQI
jgi:hypothetical protein